ncbi:sulfatase-like hydrolase/transferase [Gottschalkiaceae bacterium SANA]|nr:sulfatase-like hydrolase/transferase [Gottschalkiaceae bacterium SANA]
MKELLIYLSDQHNPMVSGVYGNPWIDTPNLDRIAQEGHVFENAYTPCPLCVPARLAFLTGKRSSKINVFNNDCSLAGDQPTIAHAIGARGYETLLIGRMHFKGVDQTHGFDEHLVGDITTQFWGNGGNRRTDLGAFMGTTNMKGCLDVVGGGDSPVLDFDECVVDETLRVMNEKSEAYRFIVTGTYAPHFSYAAPKELYLKYKERLHEVKVDIKKENHAAYQHMEREIDDDLQLSIRAAYYGMVETMDQQIGQVYDAWKQRLKINGREGIFVYVSDHGDMLGERKMVGKQTFYESSVRIPLLIAGNGIEIGRTKTPVSLLDLSRSLIDWTGADPLPDMEGENLMKIARYGRRDPVIAEHVIDRVDGCYAGKMIVQGDQKAFSFDEIGELAVYQRDENGIFAPKSVSEPEKCEWHERLKKDWNPKETIERYKQRKSDQEVLVRWGKKKQPKETARVVYKRGNFEKPQF